MNCLYYSDRKCYGPRTLGLRICNDECPAGKLAMKPHSQKKTPAPARDTREVLSVDPGAAQGPAAGILLTIGIPIESGTSIKDLSRILETLPEGSIVWAPPPEFYHHKGNFVFCDQTNQGKQPIEKDADSMKTWVTYGTMGIVQP